jgi:hypothetical protein
VLKKPSRNLDADVPDVPADNPAGAMERFTADLRRVLAAPKNQAQERPKKRRWKYS